MYKLLSNKKNKNLLRFLKIEEYKLPYIFSHLQSYSSQIGKSHQENEYDLVFVIDEGNRGWILEAVCKEIESYFPGKCKFVYAFYFPGKNFRYHHPTKLPPLPPAKAYFFAHYSYFAVCLRLYPILWSRKSFIYYTHPKGIMSNEEFAYVMNKSTQVICMCSEFAKLLVSCGVNSQKVTYAVGAADPKLFQPHQRQGDGAVGFCTAYYPRKEPERIFNIIKQLPHRKFILLGKNWEEYEKYTELVSLPNLSYIQASYSEYPQYYAMMDVFVSPAKLEGGPIPLIESMMCNVVPVASQTGFAPDIITDGQNGFLFDVESSAEVICQLIEKAFQLQGDIRKTVEHLSWEGFSHKIQNIINVS